MINFTRGELLKKSYNVTYKPASKYFYNYYDDQNISWLKSSIFLFFKNKLWG